MRVLNQVGYMTQASALYEELTIRESINFFVPIYGGPWLVAFRLPF